MHIIHYILSQKEEKSKHFFCSFDVISKKTIKTA